MTTGPRVDLWWADLTRADARLEAGLPARERARLEGLEGAARARRMVGSWLLLEAVRRHRAKDGGEHAGEHGDEGEAAELPVIDRTCSGCGQQHGRPVVAGGPHVSLAHAGVLVLVATCAQAPVGVDVERVARFAAQQPGADPASAAVDPAQAATAWVAHEARFKAGGTSGGQPVPLAPPLPGYAAALCLAGSGAGMHLVEHR